jgi:hypothetical protein
MRRAAVRSKFRQKSLEATVNTRHPSCKFDDSGNARELTVYIVGGMKDNNTKYRAREEERKMVSFDEAIAGEINLDSLHRGFPLDVPVESELLASGFEFAPSRFFAIVSCLGMHIDHGAANFGNDAKNPERL